MSIQLRRGMISEAGPGWAVIDADDKALPGRWADEETAEEEGDLGVYLFSGNGVQQVTA